MERSAKILMVLVAAASALACVALGASTVPTADVSTIVAATLRALTGMTALPTQGQQTPAVPTQAAPKGTAIQFGGVSFVIPNELAGGALSEAVAAVDEQSGAPWEVAPAYTKFTLQGYPLQGTFFQPQLMVYPAQDYTALNNGGAMSIQRLQAVLASPAAAIGNDVLPRLPWANAEQLIGAQIKIISFDGGAGVRVLAEYAQYNAAINNHELFYHFEGLTSDGRSYIVATLPIQASFLPADPNPASAVPSDGIAFPGTDVSDPGVWTNYYLAVTSKLNATAADAFQPALNALDALFQSLKVAP